MNADWIAGRKFAHLGFGIKAKLLAHNAHGAVEFAHLGFGIKAKRSPTGETTAR